MFNGIRRWWYGVRHSDQTSYVTSTRPVDREELLAAPPEEHPKPIRVRVTCGETITSLNVVDVETGRPLHVFAAEWHADFRGSRIPQLTLKTYLRDFEYEGPATLFTYCPKCKELQSDRGTEAELRISPEDLARMKDLEVKSIEQVSREYGIPADKLRRVMN